MPFKPLAAMILVSLAILISSGNGVPATAQDGGKNTSVSNVSEGTQANDDFSTYYATISTSERFVVLPQEPPTEEVLSNAITVYSDSTKYFLRVDLQDPAVDVRVGLAKNDSGGLEPLSSMKNRYANQGFVEWAVINGDYFSGNCPTNVNCAQGLTYIDGVRKENWSAYGTTWPVRGNIGFTASNDALIAIGNGQTKRYMTIAGGPWIMQNGGTPTCSAQYNLSDNTTYFSTGEQFTGDQTGYCTTTGALTMMGLSADHRYLYLGVSTGGMNVKQLAQWLKDRGAHDVLKLDGGVSSGIYHNGTLRGSATRAIANHLAIAVSGYHPPTTDTVTVYENPDFDQNRMRFGWHDPGPFNLPDYLDNKSSSLWISDGWSVHVFDGLNQTPPSKCFNGTDSNFADDRFDSGSTVDNAISSVFIHAQENCPKPGDSNGDGRVNGIDYVTWVDHYGETTTRGPADGDFNYNGKVDGIDYVIWVDNYGL